MEELTINRWFLEANRFDERLRPNNTKETDARFEEEITTSNLKRFEQNEQKEGDSKLVDHTKEEKEEVIIIIIINIKKKYFLKIICLPFQHFVRTCTPPSTH